MKCSKTITKFTGFIHVFALFVTFAGMAFQFNALTNDQPYAIWLPVSLALMMLLRIPNQVCVAFDSPHGWFSVIGSIIGLIGYVALTVVTNIKANEKNKSDIKQ